MKIELTEEEIDALLLVLDTSWYRSIWKEDNDRLSEIERKLNEAKNMPSLQKTSSI